MTNKQTIQKMVEQWPDDISFEQALHHFGVLKKIEQGLLEADRDVGMDHDEFIAELEKENAEDQAHVAAASKKRPSRDSGVHRKGLSGERQKLHRTADDRRR